MLQHQHLVGAHHAHGHMATKTPARSKSRAENVVNIMTGRKGNLGKTPFHKKHGSVTLKDVGLGSSQNVSIPLGKVGTTSAPNKSAVVLQTQPRPLVDKTPFPNRAATATKLNKSMVDVDSNLEKLPKLLETIYPSGMPREDEKDAIGIMNGERPSSMRKSVRTPRLSGTKNIGASEMQFKTPAVNGNPWDVSDGSIDMEVEATGGGGEMREAVDTDEIEYTAPNTLDLPYQPPFEFDLPDYKHLGKTLFDLAHSFPVDDGAAGLFADPVFEIEKSSWETLKLVESDDEDVDDPFRPKPGVIRSRPATRSTTRPRRATTTTTTRPDMEIMEFSFKFTI